MATQLTTQLDQYLDLESLSAYSSLGVSTLRDYIKSAGLPHFKLRGKILIKKSEFDAWLEGFRIDSKQSLNDMVEEIMDSLK